MNQAFLVVHGVGSQLRNASGERLALAFADQLTSAGDVAEIQPEDRVVSAADGTCRLGLFRVRAKDRALDVFEFYWADASAVPESKPGGLLLAWRLAVGLPRFGLRALECAAARRELCFGRLALWSFNAAWSLLIVRLFASLVVIGGEWLQLLPPRRIAEWMLVADLSVGGMLAAFSLATAPAWVCRSDGRARIGLAYLSLTAALFLTTLAPYAVRRVFLGASHERVAGIVPDLDTTPLIKFSNEADVYYFTAPNTLAGLWPYLTHLAFAVILFVFAIQYAQCRRAAKTSPGDAAPDRLAGPERFTFSALTFAAFLTVCVGPAVDLITLYSLMRGNAFGYLIAEADAPGLTRALLAYCRYEVVVISTLLLVPLLSGKIRNNLIGAGAELLFDSLNYFESFPGSDSRFRRLAWLFGGRSSSLEPRLPRQLAAVINKLTASYDSFCVVAHSLGSVIACDALTQRIARPVDLVTAGSPIAKLRRLYPNGEGLSLCARDAPQLYGVRTWANAYRSGDLIGRSLAEFSAAATAAALKEFPLGDGGHGDYFGDEKLARLCLAIADGPTHSRNEPVERG